MYQTADLYLTPDVKLSGIILNNPYLLLLLEHFNISVPLQEKRIREVCEENYINTDVFLTFAHLYNGTDDISSITFSFGEIQTIISYLRNSHKYYTQDIYPNIQHIIKEMYQVNNHKEMVLVEKFFNGYFHEVAEHLDYEDDVVFPYISDIYQHIINQEPYQKNINYSVTEYKNHHNDIKEKLSDLKNLLIKYLPLKDDGQIRRRLLFSLSELDYDLTVHSKIEDLILIPLVEKMELHLNGQQ
jgi:regulator of cell morphogenesis and NO signaling